MYTNTQYTNMQDTILQCNINFIVSTSSSLAFNLGSCLLIIIASDILRLAVLDCLSKIVNETFDTQFT